METQVKKDADLDKLDPKRFRANIFGSCMPSSDLCRTLRTHWILTEAPTVVSGTPAYDEDSWTKIRLTDPSHKEDQSDFHVSCRTTR